VPGPIRLPGQTTQAPPFFTVPELWMNRPALRNEANRHAPLKINVPRVWRSRKAGTIPQLAEHESPLTSYKGGCGNVVELGLGCHSGTDEK
jgi:hypothetical protein